MTSQRVAIVTGGSRGIGRAIVRRLAADGYQVVVNFAGNQQEADAAVAEAGAENAIAVQADVADAGAVEALFATAVERFGGVDVVVNSAGRMDLAPLADFDLDVLDEQLRVNLRGTLVVSQQVIRALRDGGALINLSSSVVGLAIPPDQGIAGYVFTTGQPLALSDVARDARFGRAAAEQTGYVPRSVVAVPLVDDEGSIGVLEVLDKRGDGAFDLRDVELATVFARQATVAIRASRIERDTAALLRAVLVAVDGAAPADSAADPEGAALDALIAAEVARLDADGDDPLWAIADEIARLRTTDPGQLELVRDLLAVLVRRAERGRLGRARSADAEAR